MAEGSGGEGHAAQTALNRARIRQSTILPRNLRILHDRSDVAAEEESLAQYVHDMGTSMSYPRNTEIFGARMSPPNTSTSSSMALCALTRFSTMDAARLEDFTFRRHVRP